MKAADHGVHLLDSRQLLGVANGVDGSGVPTAREDHKTLSLDVHHHCLVVVDQEILGPPVCDAGVVDREAPLERGRAMDLARHQHHVTQEIGWSPLFNNLNALVRQKASIGKGKMNLMAIREEELPLEECIWV